jgi:hypothetical protein
MAQETFSVRIGLTRITPTALVVKCRNHITMLTGNLTYPTPTPTLMLFTGGCNALDTANQAYEFNRGKVEKEARDTAFKAMKVMVRELAGYVQANCSNDKDLILSAGFDVRSNPSPIGLRPAPANVRALVTPFPGRLDVRWNGVRGRLIYILWMTAVDPLDPAGWHVVKETSKNRWILDGLTSNTVYSFRLQTVATAGVSPMSDISSAKAA